MGPAPSVSGAVDRGRVDFSQLLLAPMRQLITTKTFSDGCLGLGTDEGRSEMRYAL